MLYKNYVIFIFEQEAEAPLATGNRRGILRIHV